MTDMNMSEDMFLAGLESDTPDFDGLNLGYTADGFSADTTAGEDGLPSAGGADVAESEADTTADESGAKSEDTTTDESERVGTENTEEEHKENEQKEQDNSVYRLKIRGREQEVTLSEMMALAQKGADYDRVREGYDGIKGEAYRLRELAAAQGKTTEQVLDELAAVRRADEVRVTKERLLGGGVDENTATALAELLAEMPTFGQHETAGNNSDNSNGSDDMAEREDAEAGVGEGVGEGAGADIAASIRKLVSVYGVTELPKEVTKLSVDKGLPPFEAYQAWMIAEGAKREAALKQQLDAEKKNAANAAKSVGSLTGGAEAVEDAFLAGLNMEF